MSRASRKISYTNHVNSDLILRQGSKLDGIIQADGANVQQGTDSRLSQVAVSRDR